jgi:hypothetical protein
MDPAVFAAAAQVLRGLDEFDPSSWGLPPFAPASRC